LEFLNGIFGSVLRESRFYDLSPNGCGFYLLPSHKTNAGSPGPISLSSGPLGAYTGVHCARFPINMGIQIEQLNFSLKVGRSMRVREK
jgi:hypothetical protein